MQHLVRAHGDVHTSLAPMESVATNVMKINPLFESLVT